MNWMKRVPILPMLALLAACGDTPPMEPEPEPEPQPTSITVEPEEVELNRGEEIRLTATVLDQNGEVMAAPVDWISDDPEVAEINSTGLVTAVGAGKTDVLARAGAAQAVVPVTVMVTVGPVALEDDFTDLDFTGENWIPFTNTYWDVSDGVLSFYRADREEDLWAGLFALTDTLADWSVEVRARREAGIDTTAASRVQYVVELDNGAWVWLDFFFRSTNCSPVSSIVGAYGSGRDGQTTIRGMQFPNSHDAEGKGVRFGLVSPRRIGGGLQYHHLERSRNGVQGITGPAAQPRTTTTVYDLTLEGGPPMGSVKRFHLWTKNSEAEPVHVEHVTIRGRPVS